MMMSFYKIIETLMKRNENEQHLVSAILGGSTTSSISIAIICAALMGRSMRTSIEFLTNTTVQVTSSQHHQIRPYCAKAYEAKLSYFYSRDSSTLTCSSVLWEFFES